VGGRIAVTSVLLIVAGVSGFTAWRQYQDTRAVAGRFDELSQRVDAVAQAAEAPAGVLNELKKSHQKLGDRITQAESALAEVKQSLQDVQNRIAQVEATVATVAARPAPAPAPAARPRPVSPPPVSQVPVAPPPPQPEFRVLGVEMRGGERFLAIAPPSATTLDQIRLLRVGDSNGMWLLQSIDPSIKTATFAVNGLIQRLSLP
jgi:hypothetical protein